MTQLIKTTATPAVLNFLRSKGIVAYNFLGAIEHEPQLILYVDHLENPTGVFGKEDYFSYVVTDNMTFIDQMMESFFSKDDYYGFTGISKEIADYILTKNVKFHWRNDCFLYYLPEDVVLPPVDPRVETISLDAVEEINHYYEYKSQDSINNISDDLKNRPSSCIKIKGEMASWVLIHRDDTMGIMYTKEAYRKQNLAYCVTIDLMHKVRKLGKVPYVQILTSNTASQGLASKTHLVKTDPVVSWFGIIVGDLPLEDDE